ncbi:10714_t:CDS:2 [Ambispora leptoticha]|uniref:10714_t:CDS:1 n=1 Tax=Ambispora leptoticha TaxID=144679 RepID=A0A9N8ZJW1_9GLOM|nr:10714_t:CDS:2 [Ambispora leptoticha]
MSLLKNISKLTQRASITRSVTTNGFASIGSSKRSFASTSSSDEDLATINKVMLVGKVADKPKFFAPAGGTERVNYQITTFVVNNSGKVETKHLIHCRHPAQISAIKNLNPGDVVYVEGKLSYFSRPLGQERVAQVFQGKHWFFALWREIVSSCIKFHQ